VTKIVSHPWSNFLILRAVQVFQGGLLLARTFGFVQVRRIDRLLFAIDVANRVAVRTARSP
jgi:hypothetical protein